MYNTKHWLIGPSEEERIKYFLFCSDKYFLYNSGDVPQYGPK